MKLPDTLESKRLILKPISRKWSKDIFHAFTPEVTKYMSPSPAKDINGTYSFIDEYIKKRKAGTDLLFVILDKKNQEFIGCCGLHHIDRKTPELGVWTKTDSHGNGYGREAVACLYSWAKENQNYDYLIYPCDKRNIASCKIAELLGGTVYKENDEQGGLGQTLHLVSYKIPKVK